LEQAEPVANDAVVPTFRTTSWFKEQVRELRRIRAAVRDQPHAAPFTVWFLTDPVRSAPRGVLQSRAVAAAAQFISSGSPSSPEQHTASAAAQVRAAFILPPAVYTTLADRLASRPWLSTAEKLWITSQILQALQQLHAAGVVHDF
jgi:hypothetical protein